MKTRRDVSLIPEVDRYLVVIPAYNEENAIEEVIAGLKRNGHNDILVVNDNSTDDTELVLQRIGVDYINTPFNLGVGGAVWAGIRIAHVRGFTEVIQFDGDGQHLPDQIKVLRSGSGQLVVGSRLVGNRSYRFSYARLGAIRIISFLIRILFGIRISDVTSGFRLVRGPLLKYLYFYYPNEYLADTVETLVIAKKAGFDVSEVAVKMVQRREGSPSEGFFGSIFLTIKLILSLFVERIRA